MTNTSFRFLVTDHGVFLKGGAPTVSRIDVKDECCPTPKQSDGFTAVAADKSHARIIWDCSWAHEGDVFATASRDKTVRILVLLR